MCHNRPKRTDRKGIDTMSPCRSNCHENIEKQKNKKTNYNFVGLKIKPTHVAQRI